MLFFRRFAVGLLLVEAFVGRDSPCAVATVSGASNGATSGASNGGSRRRRQQQQREEQRRQRASDAGSRLSSSPSPRYMHVSPRSSLFEASSSLNTSAGATSCGDTGAASPIASTLQSSVSRLASSSHRRACGLYVWDAPSAFLHAWCNRLMRDCVYEGRGGRKFVRIEPGSILQLLYPCSRYSADRCLLCGGTHRDHLELRWSRHLYTPLDRVLDDTHRRGIRIVHSELSTKDVSRDGNKNPSGPVDASGGGGGGARSGRHHGPRKRKPSARARREATRYMTDPNVPSVTTEHAFHRDYVVETDDRAVITSNGKRKTSVFVPTALALSAGNGEADPPSRRHQRPRRSSSTKLGSAGGLPMEVVGRGRLFGVPRLDPTQDFTPLLILVRALILHAVENLMDLEGKEEN